ncbi:NAD(P)-dependent oxidoreductase, partial [Amphritea sp. 1_MG-2023]|uniref:NAD(P)-dependent oxidoreductase n=1 Tax=Amphritea sp. 1_MG-2023 TaxID=3062670 RepID=UPI0026E3D02D
VFGHRQMHKANAFSFRHRSQIFVVRLIDEKALIKNLRSKKISTAGLDVPADEANHNSQLISLENVIVTPHVGFLSKESLMESRRIALEQIVMSLSKGLKPTYAVNHNITTRQ